MSSNDDTGARMLIDSPEDLGAVIRSRRRSLGLTQADLAARAEVSRQWLVEVESGHPRAEIGRLLEVLKVLDLELTTTPACQGDGLALDRMLPAPSLARAVRKEIAGGDTNFALRLIGRSIDEFRHLARADWPAFLASPPSTGDHRWDTLIAAAFRRECRRFGVDTPSWAAVTPLPTWWFPIWDRLLVARTMQRTPIDFSVLGIWLDAKALEVA
jgi:HTH-type transcriptional regulator/antitoxin HipB